MTSLRTPRATLAAVDVFRALSRISGDVLRTPFLHAPWTSAPTAAEVHLKLECLQRTGSFKVRGAFNALRQLPQGTHVVTASAGNHGRAIACAAEALGLSATIFTPRDAPRVKLQAIARHGADLQAIADDYDDAERRAKRVAASSATTLVLADDPAVIAGAGTIACEMFDQLPELDAIVVPLGSGGLLSGIAIVAHAVAPEVEIIGVEAAASTAYSASLAAGRIVGITVQPTIAEGLAGNLAQDSVAFDYVRRLVDRVVTVEESALCEAIRDIAAHERVITEGAGAAAVAALLYGDLDIRGRRVAAVVSGGNIDMDRLRDVIRGRDDAPGE